LALLFDETPVDVSDEIKCLAQNIYFEARSEPELGKLGVAFVVMNRVASKRFPDTVCNVVRQGGEERRHHCQFSWWCDGKSDSPTNFPSWSESLKIAGAVYWGRLDDPTSGALWYHADYVAPSWSKIFHRGPKIGRHIFYGPARDKGERPQLASRSLD
jgi:spore germination cell wall hydrolase CwlJ-like protein